MIARSEAEEHLRIIRTLMERATIYRALSAPAALVGGLLSLGAAGFVVAYQHREGGTAVPSAMFMDVWSVVFVITAAVSLLLIKRDAARRDEPFLSVGFRSAMQAMLPAMLVAGVLTIVSFTRATVPGLVPYWITFYGLALLGMTHFAPRSVGMLGWAFTLTGAAALSGLLDPLLLPYVPRPSDYPSLLMGGTFGLFHLIYAACTWPRRA
jgi:hypothetical protein